MNSPLACLAGDCPRLWVPGWSMGASAWAGLPAALGEAPASALVDLSQARQAAEFLPLLANALPPRPAWLMGWSMGGMLALELALAQPQRVAGLILLATPPALVASAYSPGWPPSVLSRMRQRLRSAPAATCDAFLAQVLAGGPTAPGMDQAASAQLAWGASQSPWPVAALDAGLAYLAETQLWSRLAHLRVPAIWLPAGADQIAPAGLAPRLRQALSGVPRQIVHELPGCCHAAHWTAPGLVAAAIRQAAAELGHG